MQFIHYMRHKTTEQKRGGGQDHAVVPKKRH